MDFCKGLVVRSRAGRDKDSWCVVLEVQDNFALIANGALHRLEKPKKKKLMHLARTTTVLAPQDYATDKMLKKALQAQFGQGSAATQGGQELV